MSVFIFSFVYRCVARFKELQWWRDGSCATEMERSVPKWNWFWFI